MIMWINNSYVEIDFNLQNNLSLLDLRAFPFIISIEHSPMPQLDPEQKMCGKHLVNLIKILY